VTAPSAERRKKSGAPIFNRLTSPLDQSTARIQAHLVSSSTASTGAPYPSAEPPERERSFRHLPDSSADAAWAALKFFR